MFMTGKKEIIYLCKRITLALKKGKKRGRQEVASEDEELSFDGEVQGQELLDVQVMPLYS